MMPHVRGGARPTTDKGGSDYDRRSNLKWVSFGAALTTYAAARGSRSCPQGCRAGRSCCSRAASGGSHGPSANTLKILLQNATSLDEQAAIDRLVRHLVSLVIGIGVLQPPRNLLGRPIILQLGSDQLPQLFMPCQLAQLWTQGAIPGTLVGSCRAIASMTAVAVQLTTDSRGCTSKLPSNRSQRHTGSHASRDLFAIIETEHPS